MKQYTTPKQTAQLIELGFDRPKSISSIKVIGALITTAEDLIGEPSSVMGGKIAANYSIGELIEMLPSVLDDHKQLCIESSGGKWWVTYINLWDKKYFIRKDELIDALYKMIVKLKEEGVI